MQNGCPAESAYTSLPSSLSKWLEQSGSKGDCVFVRSSWVIDVDVEMHLLRDSVRPVGKNTMRCKLHADSPLSSSVDDAMPCLVLNDVPTEHPSPERALGSHVSRVEHDHATHEVHDVDAAKCHRGRARTSAMSTFR